MTPSYSDDGDIENESGSDNEEENDEDNDVEGVENDDDNDGEGVENDEDNEGEGGENDEDNDGEAGDEADTKGNKSGQSSGDESSDEGASGSEDSSDMDATECEKKRHDYIDDLNDLERQFAILNEQLYRERMTQIESKLGEVKEGQGQEYLLPLEELQENMRVQLEVSEILSRMRQTNIQCKFEAEEIATRQNYESEKELIWDSIKEDLEEKIRRLEEDKNNVDFSTGLWEQTARKAKRRKIDPGDPDRRRKPVTVTGPYIVYMLQEADIIEDWTLIKKSLVSITKQQN